MTVLFGLLLGVGFAEIGVRLSGVEPPLQRSKRMLSERSNPYVSYHCYPSNPHGEFEPVPDTTQGDWRLETYTFEPKRIPLDRLSETPWCVEYVHSSQWIRDREYPPQPPPGVLRMAAIGDSFVYGEGVPERQTLSRQLEAALGDGYEIINGGQVGADTAEELRVLAKIVDGAACTRAIFVFIPNDVALTPRLARRQEYINDLILIRDQYLEQHLSQGWLTSHLKVTQVIAAPFQLARIERDTIQWYLDSYDRRYNRQNLVALEQSIRSLAGMPNCRAVLVIYPLLEGFEDGYPLAPIHRRVLQMARESGLPALDLAPVFGGMSTESLWVHPADHHPNGRAHQIAAKAIARWLHSDVPGFLQPERTENVERKVR